MEPGYYWVRHTTSIAKRAEPVDEIVYLKSTVYFGKADVHTTYSSIGPATVADFKNATWVGPIANPFKVCARCGKETDGAAYCSPTCCAEDEADVIARNMQTYGVPGRKF